MLIKEMEYNNRITIEDFASSIGVDTADISDDCRRMIAKTDLRYRVLEGAELNKVILDVLKRIDSDRQKIASPGRRLEWQMGWEENLADFIQQGHAPEALTPKFLRKNQIMRFNKQYILPANPNFERDYFSIFRLWLFTKYFKSYDVVYDFGCGSGFNLLALARLYPNKRLYGLDFVESSIKLINKIRDVCGTNMEGMFFDMASPDENLKIESNGAIFTSGSIEQLGGQFEKFLQFLLRRSPGICVHIEPILELYREDNMLDSLAIKFHKKRGYTAGYLTRLRELEAKGEIEIIKVKRPFFGSLFMEGYSLIIWKPKPMIT